MTTLIVGCGYLGQRLGTRLRQQGERVIRHGPLARPRPPGSPALGIEPIIADVLVPDVAGPAAGRRDVSSTASGSTAPPAHSMRTVYVDGLQNVLDATASSR